MGGNTDATAIATTAAVAAATNIAPLPDTIFHVSIFARISNSGIHGSCDRFILYRWIFFI
jgi:hypothetical protein